MTQFDLQSSLRKASPSLFYIILFLALSVNEKLNNNRKNNKIIIYFCVVFSWKNFCSSQFTCFKLTCTCISYQITILTNYRVITDFSVWIILTSCVEFDESHTTFVKSIWIYMREANWENRKLCNDDEYTKKSTRVDWSTRVLGNFVSHLAWFIDIVEWERLLYHLKKSKNL